MTPGENVSTHSSREVVPFNLPDPPNPVNAMFNDNKWFDARIYPKEGDVTIIGRLKRVEQYDNQTIGDYNYYSYYIAYDVLKIEKGEWKDSQILFATYDAMPTLESGIVVKKAIFPFENNNGDVIAFSLDTTKSPAIITGIQRRQSNPPYEPWPK